LLAWSQITARLALPGAAFFLAGAALVSNLVPHAEEALSIRSVERITVVALIVILFDSGLNVGWHRFRTALPAIGLLAIVGTDGIAGLIVIFARYLFGFRCILAGILGAALAPTDPAMMFPVLRGRQIGGRASIAQVRRASTTRSRSHSSPPGRVRARGSRVTPRCAARVPRRDRRRVRYRRRGGRGRPLPTSSARFPAEGLYGIAGLVAAGLAYGAASSAHGSGFLAVFIVGVLLGAERTPRKGEIERFSRALASFAEMTAFTALGRTIDLGILGSRDLVRRAPARAAARSPRAPGRRPAAPRSAANALGRAAVHCLGRNERCGSDPAHGLGGGRWVRVRADVRDRLHRRSLLGRRAGRHRPSGRRPVGTPTARLRSRHHPRFRRGGATGCRKDRERPPPLSAIFRSADAPGST
jgi:hypothetical protein